MADLETCVTVIDACGRAGVPPLLLSSPGKGKSSVVRALAASHGVICETVLGSIREPADIAGLPIVRGDDYVLAPPAWAKRLSADGPGSEGVLFLDELTTCPPSVQGAMLAVVLDRVVGDLVLPPKVRVIAGANPAGSAAGGYDLEPPMANRFCHINYSPTTDDWIAGMTTGWTTATASRAITADRAAILAARTAVLGFIQSNPGLLDGFADADQHSGPWPSPRTWDMLSKAMAFVRREDTAALATLVNGLVGEATGSSFIEWLKAADLPDTTAVVDDPAIVDWKTCREDRLWTILTGVVAWAADRSTGEAWRQAWDPIVAALEAGRTDLAAAAARKLGKTRPPNAAVPKQARKFAAVLTEAGLLGEAA